MKILSSFALVSCLALAACAGASSEEGAPSTAATTSTTSASLSVDAKVARIVHLPTGEVTGVVLADGSIVRVPPHATTAGMSALKVGDAVHVEGRKAPHGPGIVGATITKDGVVLAQHEDGEAGPPHGHGGPMMGPPDRKTEDRFASLATVSRTAKVSEIDADPRGRAHALTLDDGTTVYLPPFAKTNVKVGDSVTVSGKGGEYSGGAAIAAQSIKIGDADTVTFQPPATVQREGTVERVLANPHGDADALLLDDGTVVELGPMTSAPVAAGTTITLEGHAMGTTFHARSLSVDGKTIDLSALRPARPDHGPRAAKPGEKRGARGPDLESLTAMERTSKIRALVADPEGEARRLVLEDGTAVSLPPFAKGGAQLTVGQEVTVEGRGSEGRYGTSMVAQSIRADGKEIVTVPAMPAPPEAPAE